MITRHNPPDAPVVRRYSQVVRVDLADAALLFVSGLVSVDRNGQHVGRRDLQAQADQLFRNLGTVLASPRRRLRTRREDNHVPEGRRRPNATRREAIRCLKLYIAREVHSLIRNGPTLATADIGQPLAA